MNRSRVHVIQNYSGRQILNRVAMIFWSCFCSNQLLADPRRSPLILLASVASHLNPIHQIYTRASASTLGLPETSLPILSILFAPSVSSHDTEKMGWGDLGGGWPSERRWPPSSSSTPLPPRAARVGRRPLLGLAPVHRFIALGNVTETLSATFRATSPPRPSPSPPLPARSRRLLSP